MSDELLASIINDNIKYLKSYIKDDEKDNLYKNLSTFQVFKDNNVNNYLKNSQNIENGNILLGLYSMGNNSIVLFNENLNKIKLIYNDVNNKISSRLILHELFHMASTNKDKYLGGINTYKNGDFDILIDNTGLNEGITEKLAYEAYPSLTFMHSAYIYELLLTLQLSCIIGSEVINKSYFNNYGTNLIEEELSKYLGTKEESKHFIYNFQKFYKNKMNYNDLSLLGNLQITLVKAFINKVKYLNEIEGNKIIDVYMKYIISPHLIKVRNNVNNEIPNLRESINMINNFEFNDIIGKVK